jgi:hypothetical protein
MSLGSGPGYYGTPAGSFSLASGGAPAAGAGGAAAPYSYQPYPLDYSSYGQYGYRAPPATTVLSPPEYTPPPREPIARTAPINWGGAGPLGPTGYLSAMGGTTPSRAPGTVGFGTTTTAPAAIVERSRAPRGSIGRVLNSSTGYEGSQYPKFQLRQQAYSEFERTQDPQSMPYLTPVYLAAENARRRAEYVKAHPGAPWLNAAAAAASSLFPGFRRGGKSKRRRPTKRRTRRRRN